MDSSGVCFRVLKHARSLLSAVLMSVYEAVSSFRRYVVTILLAHSPIA